MTRLSAIPKKASVEAQKKGVVNSPGESNHGKRAEVILYTAFCGHMPATQKRWLVIKLEDGNTYVLSYSGRNLHEGMQQFMACESILDEVANEKP